MVMGSLCLSPLRPEQLQLRFLEKVIINLLVLATSRRAVFALLADKEAVQFEKLAQDRFADGAHVKRRGGERGAWTGRRWLPARVPRSRFEREARPVPFPPGPAAP